MKITVHYQDWKASFNRNVKLQIQKDKNAIREAVQELFKRIQERTPIGNPNLWKWPAPKDYVPGTLRASWELTEEVNLYRIVNAQPYAQRVEYGWSTQAPAGMLRISLLEWPRIVETMSKFR
jgi:hypothetical protein